MIIVLFTYVNPISDIDIPYKQFQFVFIACHLFYFLISTLLKLKAKNTLLLKFRGFHDSSKLVAIYGF